MSLLPASARTAWRVLRAEGLAGAVDRARDRAAEWRDERRAVPAAAGSLGRAPVLGVMGLPAVARLGGVPLQLAHRLACERRHRPTALLSRTSRGWRLDWRHVSEHRAQAWEAAAPARAALEDAALEDAIARAVEETDARGVHFEGLAGLAPRSVLRASARVQAVVTVHDFSPYCPRPHLWEAPAARFCAWSRDEGRCLACLSADHAVGRGFEREWRDAMADVLRAAAAIVHPSGFMRSAWSELLPELDPGRQHVVEPGAPAADLPERRPANGMRRVGLVGAATVPKGAGLLGDIVPAAGGLEFTVLGGGDAALLRALRRLPRTQVRGYYQAGALPHLLRERGIDVALLLSLVPESYGLTLDECWQAGVPVVAFDHGAVAERIRRFGGGVLVPLQSGAGGVAAVLRDLREGKRPLPATPPPGELPSSERAAQAHLGLYRRLGLLE
jgi:hypothetical protein